VRTNLFKNLPLVLAVVGLVLLLSFKPSPKHESPVQGSVVQVVLQPTQLMWMATFAPTTTPTPSPVPVAANVNETPQDLGSDSDPTWDSLVTMVKAYAVETNEYPKNLSDEVIEQYLKLVTKYTPDDTDSLWIFAMLWQESKMKADEVSSDGAVGLLQLMPNTAEGYGVTVKKLYDPETNIKTGAKHMGDLLAKYKGNLRMATIAYNQGTGNVSRGTYNDKYYRIVNKHYKRMSALLN
jgi:soluble lytic murein transglycosylase-like protein